MFVPRDILRLTDEGLIEYDGKVTAQDKFVVSNFYQDSIHYPAFYVVTNLAELERNQEPTKPLKVSLNQISRCFTYSLKEDGGKESFFYNGLRLFSDEELLQKHPKWLKKRDTDFDYIKPFTTPSAVWLYLGRDLNYAIQRRADYLRINRKAITRPLNRFIALFCELNSLLAVNYNNVGKGVRIYKRLKPGPKKTPDGYPVLSQSKVVTLDIKQKIKKFVWANRFNKIEGKFQFKKAYENFVKVAFAKPRYTVKNGKEIISFSIEESECINYSQFLRHTHQVFTDIELFKIKQGIRALENNRRDKTGDARDGLYNSALSCEIDSTTLPIYLRYPLDRDNRLTAGKVYLCVVVSIPTHYVLGFSLSFTPPIWENVMEALLNCMQNKREFAAKYGFEVNVGEWDGEHLPIYIRLDNGPENPTEIISKIVASKIDIQDVDYCPPGKPAAKGVIENILHLLQDALSQLDGTVVKDSDGFEQHASQRAMFDREQLYQLLIHVICIHNSTSTRENLLTQEMAIDDVDITPASLFNYLNNHDYYGRPKVSQEDLPKFFWRLLRKQSVTVTPSHVQWQSMQYHCDWAEQEGWFSRANYHGRYKVEMVNFGDNVDSLYFVDAEGYTREFKLTTKSQQFKGMTLIQAKLRRYELNERKHILRWAKLTKKVTLQATIDEMKKQVELFYAQAPKNSSKSIQRDIDIRNHIMRDLELKERAKRHLAILESGSPEFDQSSFHNDLEGFEDDLEDYS